MSKNAVVPKLTTLVMMITIRMMTTTLTKISPCQVRISLSLPLLSLSLTLSLSHSLSHSLTHSLSLSLCVCVLFLSLTSYHPSTHSLTTVWASPSRKAEKSSPARNLKHKRVMRNQEANDFEELQNKLSRALSRMVTENNAKSSQDKLELSTLRSQARSHEALQQQMDASLKALNDRIEELQTMDADNKKIIASHQIESDASAAAIRDLKFDQSMREKSLDEANESIIARVSELENTLEALKDKLRSTEADLVVSRQQYDAIQQDLHLQMKLNEKLDKLTPELQLVKDERNTLRSRLIEVNAALASSESLACSLQQKLSSLQVIREGLASELDVAQEDKTNLSSKILDLNAQVRVSVPLYVGCFSLSLSLSLSRAHPH